jgi:hypothetical protein
MIETVLKKLRQSLPLQITHVEWNDPVLVLAGPAWSLTVSCPWRVVSETLLSFGSFDESADHRVLSLRGQQVVDVERQSTVAPLDPVFKLSMGQHLELFSTDAVEPWVLRLPDEVFVSSPTDATAFAGPS